MPAGARPALVPANAASIAAGESFVPGARRSESGTVTRSAAARVARK